MKARIKIEGLKDLTQALAKLDREEIPRATRNALNDIARDVQQREEQEIARVFHRPVRIIQRPFYVKRASKENLVAELRLKDKFSGILSRVLEPHVPGFVSQRKAKGMEQSLRRKGHLAGNEYLVPSRTQRLDAFGNVPKSAAFRMVNDLSAFGDSEKGSKYLFGEITPRGKSSIKGIWEASKFQKRRPGALAMLVVGGAPSYGKRFRFYEVGARHTARVAPRHAEMAVDHALKRAKLR